jgi:GntR family histidine utilization transcriptional repressor
MNAVAKPLYELVKHHVLGRIRSGELKPGSRVESEYELVRALKVSRMTANRALRELVQSGVLARVPGRGTFVADLRSAAHPLQIRNIAADIQSRGHVHRARVVLQELVECPAVIALRLSISHGMAFHSLIVHHENELPLQVEERFVNPRIAPDYLSVDFTRTTPHEYLMAVAPLERVEHVVSAVAPSATVATLLQLELSEPVLLIERTTWSQELPASFACLYHAGSRFELRGLFSI